MKTAIKIIAEIVNIIHDVSIQISGLIGLNLTDKELHFWIIGLIGIVVLIIVNTVFKKIAKLSITAISFIYTFTVLIVLVFGLEIEQHITGRGVMEFDDIVSGLWGFFVLFGIYLIIRAAICVINKIINKSDEELTKTKKLDKI